MERSIFREVFGSFGDTPFLKVLDFFITFQEFDYSKSQVAKEVGISRVTIEGLWRDLIKKEFIKKTRIVGRAELYKLDRTDPTIKALIELDMKLSGIYARKQAESTKLMKEIEHKVAVPA
jgi:hypothetical protein